MKWCTWVGSLGKHFMSLVVTSRQNVTPGMPTQQDIIHVNIQQQMTHIVAHPQVINLSQITQMNQYGNQLQINQQTQINQPNQLSQIFVVSYVKIICVKRDTFFQKHRHIVNNVLFHSLMNIFCTL